MNQKIAFIVLGSFYLFVLVASYLVAVSYTFFASYGLFLVPLVANFCVGYFIRDVYVAVKTIIIGFSLQASIILAFLFSHSASDAFVGVTVISSYYTLQVPLGIAASLAGTSVREDANDVVAVCMYLVRRMKQNGEKLLSRV